MRENQAITQKAIHIPEEYRLISRTDLKGNILEANSEFIEISGYTKEELIGQPHNLLRHPDVPSTVFKDMWNNLQQGKSWTQIVKNRCKNGDHYWVKANTSPIMENGKSIGYISVRKPATANEIAAATDAYQKINANKLVINNAIISTPQAHRWQKMNPYLGLGIMGKILVPAGLLLILAIIITALSAQQGYNEAKTLNEQTRFDTLNGHIFNKLDALKSAGLNSAIRLSTNIKIQDNLEANSSNEIAKSVLAEKLPAYEAVGGQKYKVQIHRPDATSFLRSWNDKQGDDLSNFRFTVNQVIKSQQTKAAIELGRTGIAIRSLTPIFSHQNPQKYIGSLEVITPITALQKNLANEGIYYFAVLTPKALEIAHGEAKNPKLGQYTLATQTGVEAPELAWFKEIDIEALVHNHFITSKQHFFSSYPIKDARDELVGYHLIMEDLSKVGNLNDISKANAIATVVKMTLAILIISLLLLFVVYFNISRPIKKMVNTINQAANNGDLSARLDAQFNHEMGQIGKAYNQQMETAQIAMGEAGRMIRDISQGDFKTTTVIPTTGDFNVMTQNLNRAVTTIDETFSEIKNVLSQIRHGQFSYQSKLETQGEFKEAMQQALSAMAMLRGVFHEVNELMGQVARGYFARRITAKTEGELQLLKDNINSSLDKLQSAISETTNVMIAQGAGDLKGRIESDFEGTLAILKDGINNSVTNMGSLMSQSNYSIYKLSEGAKAIAQDISDLSGRTQQQAAAVEQTAASMEEITSTIQQTANNAMDANQMANTSLIEAKSANEVVQKTIASINQINEASHKISEITTLIDSIAFQTNLLALNAAVEAARAGDHGRGFAVVAGEVRSLAGKSAEAAKQIRTLIDDTVEKVHHGATLAKESGEALIIINQSIEQISSLVNEITKTTAEQAKGVQQVNEAIGSIDQATQQNAALVDETAERTSEMRRQAEGVTNVVSTFKIDLEQIGFATAMKTGQFAFAQARRAHRQWKGLIRAFVDGMDVQIDEKVATDHTQCGLGKWFYSPEGQQYAHLTEMQTVDKYHAELHACIKRILEAYRAEDLETVEAEFHKLDQVSAKVIENLSLAEQAVAKTQHKPSASSKLAPSVAKPSRTVPSPA
ncbi:MAG: PAS domain-containing protein, partial [Thiotrichales bacterium]|nr:PAS domain-containing protein [Thiotrichales bacterium]